MHVRVAKKILTIIKFARRLICKHVETAIAFLEERRWKEGVIGLLVLLDWRYTFKRTLGAELEILDFSRQLRMNYVLASGTENKEIHIRSTRSYRPVTWERCETWHHLQCIISKFLTLIETLLIWPGFNNYPLLLMRWNEQQLITPQRKL